MTEVFLSISVLLLLIALGSVIYWQNIILKQLKEAKKNVVTLEKLRTWLWDRRQSFPDDPDIHLLYDFSGSYPCLKFPFRDKYNCDHFGWNVPVLSGEEQETLNYILYQCFIDYSKILIQKSNDSKTTPQQA